MEVTLLNNPLKIIKCRGTFKEEPNKRNELFVSLIPTYMDITKGVWNMSLDTYAMKTNKTDNPMNTVLEVTSNLVTSYKYNSENSDTFESTPAILGHMFGFGVNKSFDHFEKKWFTIENAYACGPMLRLMFNQNELFKTTPVDLTFEITILFQRIK